MPFLLEDGNDEFHERVFWQNKLPGQPPVPPKPKPSPKTTRAVVGASESKGDDSGTLSLTQSRSLD